MVERNVYKVNKSGMLQVTIPAVVAKMWGVSDITRVCIREMAPGMWKVWAPEVSNKGVSVVDNEAGFNPLIQVNVKNTTICNSLFQQKMQRWFRILLCFVGLKY